MLNDTVNKLIDLKLLGIKDHLSEYLDKITDDNLSFLEGLNLLLNEEIKHREIRYSQNNIKVAHFPFVKTISDFDFEFQPSISKNKIIDLSSLRFLEENKNVIFFGDSGVGKTHLATALGVEAASKRHSVYFINCNDLINNLLEAYRENKAAERIKHYCKYQLLIIDEIGYLPTDRNGANLFFQLISKRYENKSTIITTNLSFDRWEETFGDKTIANAIVDRLIHHSEIINIRGKSYRMKELKEQMNIK